MQQSCLPWYLRSLSILWSLTVRFPSRNHGAYGTQANRNIIHRYYRRTGAWHLEYTPSPYKSGEWRHYLGSGSSKGTVTNNSTDNLRNTRANYSSAENRSVTLAESSLSRRSTSPNSRFSLSITPYLGSPSHSNASIGRWWEWFYSSGFCSSSSSSSNAVLYRCSGIWPSLRPTACRSHTSSLLSSSPISAWMLPCW